MSKLCQDSSENLLDGSLTYGIDGIDGVGKTTLANTLAELTGFKVIHLDDYVDRNRDGYVAHLKIDQLQHDVIESDTFIIEGVCLLSILKRLDVVVDNHIYIKRLSHGLWADEHECEIASDVEEFILREREAIGLLSDAPFMPELPGLAEELIRYHHEFNPHSTADTVFFRNDA